ncbi:Negative regulator of mitotic exit [Tulasnella sp. 418]|nr:Negative regulator of mitotic exit [Tulasnella sp. 418]
MRSARSPSSAEDASGRAVELERKLAEVEQMHRQKMAKLENDYHQAVNFAKTSERVIRQVKEELNKQKSANQSLQSDLDAARGVNTSEAGSQTRNANGRNIPLSDEDGPRVVQAQCQVHHLQLENQDLRRRVEALQSELEEVRDNLVAAQRASEAKLQHAEDLEAEVKHLENAMKLSRNGAHDKSLTEQLTAENIALKNENKILLDKINVLLEVDQPGFDTMRRTSTLSNRCPASQSSSENAMALESLSNEIDHRQRRLARCPASQSSSENAPNIDPLSQSDGVDQALTKLECEECQCDKELLLQKEIQNRALSDYNNLLSQELRKASRRLPRLFSSKTKMDATAFAGSEICESRPEYRGNTVFPSSEDSSPTRRGCCVVQ